MEELVDGSISVNAKLEYNKAMSKKGLLSVGVAAMILLVFLLNNTTPTTIHPLGILLVFFLMYLVIVAVMTYVLAAIAYALRRWTPETRRRKVTLDFRHCYYFGSVLGLVPVLLMGAHSVGRSGWHDVLLVIVFEVVACIYIAKR